MPSLLLVIFVLQLLIHFVNTVGASTIENLVIPSPALPHPPPPLPPHLSLLPHVTPAVLTLFTQNNADPTQLWHLYSFLPTPTSRQLQDQQTLRTEVLRLKRELNATSSQDDFAKWAKLRRQHDKAVAAYEEKSMPSPTYLRLLP